MVSFLVVFREFAIVRKSLLINKDGIFRRDSAVDLNARLHNEVNKLLTTYQPSTLPETTKKDLVKLMEKEARRHGQDHLPLPPMTT